MLSPRPSTLDHDGFVDAYGGVYEHSAWVAEAVFAEGLTEKDDDGKALAGRMAAIVDAAAQGRKLDLLNAHPELAGKSGNICPQSSYLRQRRMCKHEEYNQLCIMGQRHKLCIIPYAH